MVHKIYERYAKKNEPRRREEVQRYEGNDEYLKFFITFAVQNFFAGRLSVLSL